VRTPKDDNILELTFEESDSDDHSQSDDSLEFDEETKGNEGCFHCKPQLFGLNEQLLDMSKDSEASQNYLKGGSTVNV